MRVEINPWVDMTRKGAIIYTITKFIFWCFCFRTKKLKIIEMIRWDTKTFLNNFYFAQ